VEGSLIFCAMCSTDINNKPELAEWLQSCGCERYADAFATNGYDSLLALRLLDQDDLDIIGVTLPGHRKGPLSIRYLLSRPALLLAG